MRKWDQDFGGKHCVNHKKELMNSKGYMAEFLMEE
jgi:hypothetical protein